MTLLIIASLLMLVIVPLAKGFLNNEGFDILLELKLYSNPYYNIGIQFIAYPEDDYIVEEFNIGLFFFNFVIVFYKPHSE